MGWFGWWSAKASDASDPHEKSSTRHSHHYDPESPCPVTASSAYHHVTTTPRAPIASTIRPPPPATPIAEIAESPPAVQWCSFGATYGRFTGPSLLVSVVIALLWTLLLLVINVSPTLAFNWLFRTQEIDDGEFWLLRPHGGGDGSLSMAQGFLVAWLACCSLYYAYLLFLLLWRRKDMATVDDLVIPTQNSCATCLCDLMTQHFGQLDSDSRPYLKVSEELPEIVYQTVLLHVFMGSGVSSPLILSFAVAVALNCFVRGYRVLAKETYHEQNDSLVNALFQFFFAVLFPLVQLTCAAMGFTMDRAAYALRLRFFEIGSFEQIARFAQPQQYTATHTVSRTLIELLVLESHGGMAIATCGLHLALLWRWHDILLGCLLGYKKQRIPTSVSVSSNDDSFLNLMRVVKAIYWFLIKILLACLCVSKRFIPNVFAVLLFLYGVAILVVTSAAVGFSSRACAPLQPQCVLYAHAFKGLSMQQYEGACPCLMYVNQPTGRVSSWTQWLARQDAASDLQEVAAGAQGKLQVVQIVDRDLAALPQALANCESLRVLVLIRTNLKEIPPWLLDMEQLQVLHLGGDVSTTFPSFPLETEVFSRMNKLRVLRLDDLSWLTSLPAFPEASLLSLRSVVFNNLPLVRSIPVMSHLGGLERLVLGQMRSLQRLPMLPATLKTLRVEMPSALCCNGYLDSDDSCVWQAVSVHNVSTALHTQCTAAYKDMNASSCLSSDTLATAQPLQIQKWLRDSNFTCTNHAGAPASIDNDIANNITRGSVVACDGALYQECSLTWPLFPANVTGGMCLGDARLQIIHCVPKDPRFEAMRHEEIQQKLGDQNCSPASENWLGC